MEKARKIGEWLWYSKERVVLVVLVLVLCVQVYRIVFPEEMKFSSTTLPQNPVLENLPTEVKPQMDFKQLPRPRLGNYALIHRRNPFWGHSGGTQGETTTEITAESLGISLEDIKELGGRVRAKLRTSSTSKWYDEGEQFEQYQLESIDIENGEVVIFAEKYSKNLTVKMKQ